MKKMRSNINLFQIIKYGFFGVITTIINLFLFYLLIKIRVHYLVSNAISYFIAVVLSYYLNNKYVFNYNEKQSEIKKIVKFIIVRILSLGLDSVCLWICVTLLKYDAFLSKIFISTVIIIVTYALNKTLVFNEKKKG